MHVILVSALNDNVRGITVFRALIIAGLLQIFQRTHVDLGLHSPT